MCKIAAIVVTIVVAALTGCSNDVNLLQNQSEGDANEVISALGESLIEAQKVQQKEGFSITISSTNMARAVKILETKGLPRKSRTNFGDVFKKEGVISTPLEERARYIYATSQELESTLNLIEGVVVSRVHVVLPDRVAPGEPVSPASAAVFIKHLPSLDPDVVKPRVERMVKNSIPGLAKSRNKLAVVFLPAQEYKEERKLSKFGPFWVNSNSLTFWKIILLFGFTLFLISATAVLVFFKPKFFNDVLLKLKIR